MAAPLSVLFIFVSGSSYQLIGMSSDVSACTGVCVGSCHWEANRAHAEWSQAVDHVVGMATPSSVGSHYLPASFTCMQFTPPWIAVYDVRSESVFVSHLGILSVG